MTYGKSNSLLYVALLLAGSLLVSLSSAAYQHNATACTLPYCSTQPKEKEYYYPKGTKLFRPWRKILHYKQPSHESIVNNNHQQAADERNLEQGEFGAATKTHSAQHASSPPRAHLSKHQQFSHHHHHHHQHIDEHQHHSMSDQYLTPQALKEHYTIQKLLMAQSLEMSKKLKTLDWKLGQVDKLLRQMQQTVNLCASKGAASGSEL